MKSAQKRLRNLALLLTPFVVLLAFQVLRSRLTRHAAARPLAGLSALVTLRLDRFGIPTIEADSRLDAVRALGYITAQDRLFQMDLLRRAAAGRLSEVVGRATLQMDIDRRVTGLDRAAQAALAHLPTEQRAVLDAYTEGVNGFLAHMVVPPPEFLALRYRPEPWRPEDSLLVGLSMFQQLTRDMEDYKRMLTVMDATLPSSLVQFLTTDEDQYATELLGGSVGIRPARPVPVDDVRDLLRRQQLPLDEVFVRIDEPATGSNGWVLGKNKTADGRALLANDLHLPLSVPNLWYRLQLCYNGVRIVGLTIPGLVMVACGSNGHVAWGITDTNGDFLDLVELEIDPNDPSRYRTPQGWEPFEVIRETIQVKGGTAVAVEVQQTIWGPVSKRPLLGKSVALHWTALDPEAINLGMIDMDQAQTIEEAVRTLQTFGGPPLNIMIAADSGRIAWTICGKIPIRRGSDGSTCRSWADGSVGWDGYVPVDELPCVIDPPEGVLVTANNRTLGADYRYRVGINYANGYRAYQARSQLWRGDRFTELDLFQLQLDTASAFYEFYRTVALEVLAAWPSGGNHLLSEARACIEAWNGRAEIDSLGLGLLVRFHRALADGIFGSYLQVCKAADVDFVYQHYLDTPLRQLLTERAPGTVPEPIRYHTWEDFILDRLLKTARRLKAEYPGIDLQHLEWGRLNRVAISHPLSEAVPLLGKVLDMPSDPLPGCIFCIRAAQRTNGVAARMVVSPGRHEDGIMHMPCGQSGNPFTQNYRDQQGYWLHGRVLPFLPGPEVLQLVLIPAAQVNGRGVKLD